MNERCSTVFLVPRDQTPHTTGCGFLEYTALLRGKAGQRIDSGRCTLQIECGPDKCFRSGACNPGFWMRNGFNLLHVRRATSNLRGKLNYVVICMNVYGMQVAAAVKLLAKGADRHLRDHEGRTAMDWANRFGSTRLLDVLLYDPNNVRTRCRGSVALLRSHD